MCCYRYFLLLAVLLAGNCLAQEKALVQGPLAAGDRVFEGRWVTTNRKLDGMMTAVVKELGDDRWQGRFYGVWQGVPFDYTVKFSGNPESLKGTAVIDFADYTWTGKIDDEEGTFTAKFGGSRYTGHFSMNEKKKAAAATTAAREKVVR